MAPSPPPHARTSRIPFGSYLFTPPENTVDSFSHHDDDASKQQWRAVQQPTLLPPLVRTPPASPHSNALPSIASATGYSVNDSPLFPQAASSERAHSQQPLFDRQRSHSPSPVRTIEQPRHTLELPPSNPKPRSQIFPHNLGINTGDRALQYWRAEMASIKRMKRELPAPHKSAACRLDPEDARQLSSLTRAANVSKSRPTPRIIARPKATVATSSVKATPPRRRTPKARSTMTDFVDAAFPQREPTTKHKRAAPSKKIDGENMDWSEIPDYAPPASDLDSNPKSLKVTWHGHALGLIDDPDATQLHDQEVLVASTLRLSCATYLANKRKIFQARLQSLKDGKNFTKTAAQSACKIDVNKASQLWEAFDRVGWFNSEWYTQYL